MSSPEFLSSFHIPHLATGAAPRAATEGIRNESPPAPEIVTGNRLVAPGKQAGSSDPGNPSPKPMKRKAKQGDGDSGEADNKLVLFPGRDESYPEELNRLIGALNCELCKVQMTSRKCARDHYESKAHDRHISAWLAKNYTEAGLQAPPVKRLAKQGPIGPNAFHCDLCDLDLTSSMHARQHYLGRKHKLLEQRLAKQSGAGAQNGSKWIRAGGNFEGQGATPSDGRYGIGTRFLQKEENASSEDVPLVGQAQAEDKERSCSLCKIVVTSAPQMQTHLAGARHQRNMKTAGLQDPGSADACPAEVPRLPEKLDPVDLAMYRTPAGQYFCQPCNMTMNHSTTLQQHLIGKKHLRMAKSLPQTDQTV
ncbi:zinc finger protein 346 [Drosophila ficusphila]|uniref:zinc finger protein 346 n=1 Tax=Drosophila ficusphila TaxID=30025 RepID=UPI0007E890EA|nr:zinc finger protein 346 [Drosophila ficusphila]